jgi:hypothetical protein
MVIRHHPLVRRTNTELPQNKLIDGAKLRVGICKVWYLIFAVFNAPSGGGRDNHN